MKAATLIEELQKLTPDEDIDEWLKARTKGTIVTLNFEQAGKAIRAILASGVGKPDVSSNMDQSGHHMRYRNCVWDTYNNIDKANKLAVALISVGITDFKITPGGWFSVRIPKDAFVSSFYHSDDPEEWKKRNEAMQAKVDAKKKAKLAAVDARYNAWKLAHEKDQALWQLNLASQKAAEKAKLLDEALEERAATLSATTTVQKFTVRAVRQED